MPDRDPRSAVELDVTLGASAPQAPRPETPFCIAVLGDFSGRGSRGDAGDPGSIASRHFHAVDRDDVDVVLGRIAPELRIPTDAGPPLELRFRELDDFHPDRLFAALPTFEALRALRDEARRPGRRPSAPPSAPAASAPRPSGGGLLDQIVAASPGGGPAPAAPAAPADGLAAYVRSIVAPHLVADRTPGSPELVRRVDEAIAAHMRAVLHHPAFQALESAWRAVDFVVRRLETGTELRVYLVDVTDAELAQDLGSDVALEATGTARLLARPAPAGAPWALLVGLQTFGGREGDYRVLERLGEIAGRLGTTFVAGGHPAVLGLASAERLADDLERPPTLNSAWSALRTRPAARSIGLVLPRFLVRLPYGADSEPCDALEFEEIEGDDHEAYLWASPALLCAMLLGQSFTEAGWRLRPGAVADVGGLPLHITRVAGEARAKPCAEGVMSERAALRIAEAGLMPLASMRDQDAVRLVRFQSAASPPAALVGPWTRAG